MLKPGARNVLTFCPLISRSTFTHRRVLGTFSASAAVQTEKTGPALKELFFELARIQSGDLSQDELSKAQKILATDTVDDFATLQGTTSRAASLATFGAPWDTIAKDMQTSLQADVAALTQTAKGALALDRAVLVLVGQRAEILQQLADPANELKLGTITVVDAEGNPVK
jgi:predicted Zn-dependent peptidase